VAGHSLIAFFLFMVYIARASGRRSLRAPIYYTKGTLPLTFMGADGCECFQKQAKIMQEPPRLGFVGYSNSGKTTLICNLIKHLTEDGFRVGAVKHHHKVFDIDHQGKDSYRFTAAGAGKTIITGPERTALIEKTTAQIPIEKLTHSYLHDLDLILVEGFKQERMPKIEIQRAELKRPLLSRGENTDEHLIAVVSDIEQELDVPCFGLEQTTAISVFIRNYFSLQRPAGHANKS